MLSWLPSRYGVHFHAAGALGAVAAVPALLPVGVAVYCQPNVQYRR